MHHRHQRAEAVFRHHHRLVLCWRSRQRFQHVEVGGLGIAPGVQRAPHLQVVHVCRCSQDVQHSRLCLAQQGHAGADVAPVGQHAVVQRRCLDNRHALPHRSVWVEVHGIDLGVALDALSEVPQGLVAEHSGPEDVPWMGGVVREVAKIRPNAVKSIFSVCLLKIIHAKSFYPPKHA